MTSIRYKIINKNKLFLVRTADSVLNLAAMCGFFSERKKSAGILSRSIKKILVIRLAYIGDVVMTLPVLEPLASAFPNASIDFLTSRYAAPLLQNNPYLNSIIPFNAPWFYPEPDADRTAECVHRLKQSEYDLGIDFRGDIRNIYHCLYQPRIRHRVSYVSGGGGVLLTHPVYWMELKHKVEYHLDLLRNTGLHLKASPPVIYLTDAEREQARRYLFRLPGCRSKAPVVIHPGARLPLKKWPVDRFIGLVRKIDELGLGPVVVIDADESAVAREICKKAPVSADLSGVFSLREMAAFLSVCRMMVCHDSGPMHISAAVNTPVVSLFGPSRPIETRPFGEGHRVIEAPCDVKDMCDEARCLSTTGNCMARIQVDDVCAQIQQIDTS